MTSQAFEYVTDSAGIAAAGRALTGAPSLFIDTEFDSSRAGKRLSLLQVRTASGSTFVIDALRVSDLRQLSDSFAPPEVEWVLHAGTQDVELLLEAFGLREPPKLFDTQVAWALLSPEHSVSLPYLVFRALGIRTEKGHQATDWMRRPLPPRQLAYAATDVEHLPALRRALGDRARERQREHLIFEASAESILPFAIVAEPLDLASFRNAWQLDAKSQAGLLFLVDWYNALDPKEQAFSPEPKTLFNIASRLPENVDELGRIKGVHHRWVARVGRQVVSGLARAAAAAQSEGFVPIDPPPYATFEEIELEGWLAYVRAELSVRLKAAPEAILPNRVLQKIRRSILAAGSLAAGAERLEGWRAELLREPYLQLAAQSTWTTSVD